MDTVSWVGVAGVYTNIINVFSTLGGRGVTMQRYLNIRGYTLSDLYSAATFPDSPDVHSVNPSFESDPSVRYGCLFYSIHLLFVRQYHGLQVLVVGILWKF